MTTLDGVKRQVILLTLDICLLIDPAIVKILDYQSGVPVVQRRDAALSSQVPSPVFIYFPCVPPMQRQPVKHHPVVYWR